MNNGAYKRPLIILTLLLLLGSVIYYQRSNAVSPPPPGNPQDGKELTPAINEQVRKQQQEIITLKEDLGKTKEDLNKAQKVIADVRDNVDWLGTEVEEKQRQQVWKDRRMNAKLDKHDRKLNEIGKQLATTNKESTSEIEGKAEIKPSLIKPSLLRPNK